MVQRDPWGEVRKRSDEGVQLELVGWVLFGDVAKGLRLAADVRVLIIHAE